jgi:hypothetical protein
MRDRLTRNSHPSRHFRLWHSGGEQLRCAAPSLLQLSQFLFAFHSTALKGQ